jgi:fused signal recognition particle receptor
MSLGIATTIVVLVVLLGVLVWTVVRQRRARRRATGTVAASGRTTTGLGGRVAELLGTVPGEDEWRSLEQALVRADVGPTAAAELVARVRRQTDAGEDPSLLLRRELVSLMGSDGELALAHGRLSVVMIVGVNGSGKTTTIGKLAAMLTARGRQVTLAGSDTFRAAASEQIEVWAERAGVPVISQERGADPSSVAFDAVRSAQAKGADVLIVDTAGRLHTRTPLMDELKKVKRVIEKAGATVDETLLVLDAQTGQNGISQARAFADAVDVTGVVLTKMDGTARGGIVLVVREELGVPVKLVGTGEGLQDLRAFEPEAFAERLLTE